MKKPTIKSLQADIARLTGEVASAKASRDAWQKDRHEINDKLREAEYAARKEREKLSNEIDGLRSENESLHGEATNYRNRVLAYFVAIANPVTASDAEMIKRLQADVCGGCYSPNKSLNPLGFSPYDR